MMTNQTILHYMKSKNYYSNVDEVVSFQYLPGGYNIKVSFKFKGNNNDAIHKSEFAVGEINNHIYLHRELLIITILNDK